MSIMQLRKTFDLDDRELFEMKLTKCNEKSFIKVMYHNNITNFVKQCRLSVMKSLR